MYNRIQNVLHTRDNQYGYKSNISTEMCIFSFKEIVKFYHKQISPVYACYLDFKSAFDKTSYYK